MSDFEVEDLTYILKQIQVNSFSDFVALALPDELNDRYRWYYTVGNRNQRYKQMLVKRGKGLPGMAILLGRSIAQDNRFAESGGKSIDCPLMWAESLQAASAAPIPSATGSGDIGVIIIGKRNHYHYTKDDLVYLQQAARQLTPLCESVHHKILS
jgi:nitrogen regulatory protein A